LHNKYFRSGSRIIAELYPGIAPDNDLQEKKVHRFYQLVPLLLIFQAILSYLPHYVWKALEGGLIEKLLEGKLFSNVDIINSGQPDQEQNFRYLEHHFKKNPIYNFRAQISCYRNCK
jgi:hypothetical protein